MNDWKNCFSPEINALAARGRALRTQLQALRGEQNEGERRRVRAEKLQVSRSARALLLVQGFARAIPYARIEHRCAEGNRASATALLWALRERRPAEVTADTSALLDRWIAGQP